jgi:4-amino-4-deoxy-L-arabinose transferase-like glycosyltransferase
MSESLNSAQTNIWKWLIGLGLAINLPGLFTDVMEIDAAQYAAISMEMAQTGSYLQVFEQGRDYLDKPPLLFWLSSLFIKIFGTYSWAYKLPSFLFTMLGIYAIFRFTRLYYSEQTAWTAAAILLYSQCIFLMNNDVRTDNMLLGAVCLSIWMLAEIDTASTTRWIYYIFAGAGIGLAMLAKGPLGLVIPLMGFGTNWLLKMQWKKILNPHWLLTILTISIILLPMCIGLYVQFDAQPEKWVNGRQGVSGLRFFFWEQSFGRITGESVWKNDSGKLFFVHTYLWAFFPWVLIIIPAIYHKFKKTENSEKISLWSFILTFIALSMSRFKLPHYIYITVPFAAVICASWYQQLGARHKIIRFLPLLPLSLAVLVSGLLIFYVFPDKPLIISVAIVTICALWLALYTKSNSDIAKNLVLMSFSPALIALVLNVHFYPNLLQYQASSNAGKYLKKNDQISDSLLISGSHRSAAHFYSGKILPRPESQVIAKKEYIWLLVNKSDLANYGFEKAEQKIERSWADYPITLLKGSFLNPRTRAESLDSTYLIRLNNEHHE